MAGEFRSPFAPRRRGAPKGAKGRK